MVTKHILYLAHDLADAAIRRRVLMLQQGGASMTVAGFVRGQNLLSDTDGVQSIVLGQTADGRFAQRVSAVTGAAWSLKNSLSGVRRPDVIVARNMEMLALAVRASRLFGAEIPVVYECLDIHRLLLDDGWKGRLMRALEGNFGRRAKLLITSSPAFVENYFSKKSHLNLPVMLLENKVLDLSGLPLEKPVVRAPADGEPWRIGWFGALRCRKSLAVLTDFANRMDGAVKIVLRGRPAYSEFADFDTSVAASPHVEFRGAYRNPEDLRSIYADVQFAWAIDFFEEGLNSNWLLPNRLYEGALHGAVPISLASTETGRFLSGRGLGLRLDDVRPETLVREFEVMTRMRYQALFDNLAAVDQATWVAGPQDCRTLVARLSGLTGEGGNTPAAMAAPAFGRGGEI